MSSDSHDSGSVRAAVEAVTRGFQPIPIRSGEKRPASAAWTRVRWTNDAAGLAKVREEFTAKAGEGQANIGLLLGEPSGGLIDVDLDHPAAHRLKGHFLPPTPMRSGRAGNDTSHYWYVAKEGTLPGTRRYKMPDRSVSVELRSTGSQTVIPPSIHPSGEDYRWEGAPWGGVQGPAIVDGNVLVAQVALLGLGTVLIDAWPKKGSRHDAYLALAGALLWYGDGEVHPFWRTNASVLIRALADATHDEDGPDARESETIKSTLARISAGDRVVGMGKLAEIVGDDAARTIREMIREVEAAAGFEPRTGLPATVTRTAPPGDIDSPQTTPLVAQNDLQTGAQQQMQGQGQPTAGGAYSDNYAPHTTQGAAAPATLTPRQRDPLGERQELYGPGGTWSPVDLDPYLTGQVQEVEPEVLQRSDGKHLMYRGCVNMLFGSSETAKTWIALMTSIQVIAAGGRVVYLDMEDAPGNTLKRLHAMGAGDDDIRNGFTYIRPEEPLAPMQRNRWGNVSITEQGRVGEALLEKVLREKDPTLIVADGMTVLYALHGLDSNDSVSTEIVASWLKKLTRNGRSTVIVIDHTAKSAEKGHEPIGSQHKKAMVQGTLLQVWKVTQPMPGAVGVVDLIVLKDRSGKVREVSSQGATQVAATITIDSTPPMDGEPDTRMMIDPPRGVQRQPTQAEIDLQRSREAEAAEKLNMWRDRVLWAFGGQAGRLLKLSDVMERLAYFTPTERDVKRALDSLSNGRDQRGQYLVQTRITGKHDWSAPWEMPKGWAVGRALGWELMVGEPDYDPDAVLAELMEQMEQGDDKEDANEADSNEGAVESEETGETDEVTDETHNTTNEETGDEK